MATGKLTWAAFKNHLHYGKWIYLAIAVVAWFGFDLLYTMTAYRAPDERKVDVYLVQGAFTDVEALDPLAAYALDVAQAHDDTLEEVNFVEIQYSGDPDTDVYGAQKFGVMLQARQGDVWVLPRERFMQIYEQGGTAPLGGFAEAGLLDLGGIDTAAYLLPAPSGETDELGDPLPPSGEAALYGLPASAVPALAEIGYVPENAVIALMVFSTNPETSVVALNALIHAPDNLPTSEEAS